MDKSPHEQLPLFIQWSEFVPWLVAVTAKFPKTMRFSLTTRLDNLALDVLEKIVEACYSRDKQKILQEIDLLLEKMRVLLRMAHLLRFVGTKSYEHAVQELREAGRQVGGWRRQQWKK